MIDLHHKKSKNLELDPEYLFCFYERNMNLSASGGGGVKSTGESGVAALCGDWANISPPEETADRGLCICS
jgi:hypothetical protein